MNRRSFLAAATLSLMSTSVPRLVAAQSLPPGQWDLLGTRRVKFRAERDVIVVGPHEGTFSAIMLDVLGSHPIEILSCTVVFGNDERREIAVGELLQPRAHTRVIDVPGGLRLIRRVELVYRARGAHRGHGQIRVFGLR